MNNKKKILFGASEMGQKALIYFKEDNVSYFCDNDIKKIGTKFLGIDVIGFDKLLDIYKDFDIVITSMYSKQISEQLKEHNINSFAIYKEDIEIYFPVNDLKIINLGDFLNKSQLKIKLETLTFFQGGSTILDYIFLKALAEKFKIKKYLEIGSFMGESIKCLNDICEECVSISLEDKYLEEFFYSVDKENFGSYFMKNLDKVRQIKGDSKKINLNEINFEPDLVFIDGDHSYNGVFNDTKKVFDFIDCNETIVVWHDFRKAFTKDIRTETVKAVFDSLEEKYINNIFVCDNNLCGIYIPNKYLKHFSTEVNSNEMYSYEFEMSKVVKNTR